MIAEFLKVSAAVQDRAGIVGRAIIQWKHFAIRDASVILLNPIVSHVDKDHVQINIGATMECSITVSVPVPLFDDGSLGDIRTWITRQNAARELEVSIVQDEQRAKEVSVLNQLLDKYPEERWRNQKTP